MNPCSALDEFRQGKPLVELWIRFQPGIDCVKATEFLQGLGPDIDVFPGDYYHPDTRHAQITAPGMLRLFNVRVQRIPLPPEFPDAYTWRPIPATGEWPAALQGIIAEMGMIQPGSYDDGQAYPAFEGA